MVLDCRLLLEFPSWLFQVLLSWIEVEAVPCTSLDTEGDVSVKEGAVVERVLNVRRATRLLMVDRSTDELGTLKSGSVSSASMELGLWRYCSTPDKGVRRC